MLVILRTYKRIKIWFALVFAFSTSNIVSRLPEEFGDKAATSAIIQSRPMMWLRRFGPQGTQRQRRWRLAELTAG
jgi:hypothetical protein